MVISNISKFKKKKKKKVIPITQIFSSQKKKKEKKNRKTQIFNKDKKEVYVCRDIHISISENESCLLHNAI